MRSENGFHWPRVIFQHTDDTGREIGTNIVT